MASGRGKGQIGPFRLPQQGARRLSFGHDTCHLREPTANIERHEERIEPAASACQPAVQRRRRQGKGGEGRGGDAAWRERSQERPKKRLQAAGV